MKPHIYKAQKLWFCGIIDLWFCGINVPYRTVLGIGYTPRQAYQDWIDLGAGKNAEAKKLKVGAA